ncbi:MMPL family transporter [Nocardia sp. NBC_00565]|uniref:MMPL family transporter n=1 Tax=Nocardia sp. NBC_00565 TaxID=2975993 RepID=UPI002E8075C4|nr:MMPL family transporter [Nocardia sp. NBC_00565]WUC04110.1 MMPL family transporter [Nocardia sp. NBC_00565]
MLVRIAHLTTRHPRAILLAAALLAVLCGVFGASAAAHMKTGGFTPTEAESSQVSRLIADNFGGGEPNLILLVRDEAGANSPAAKDAGAKLVDTLRSRGDVIGIQSYWSAPQQLSSALRSTDGKSALVLGYITGDETTAQNAAGEIAEQVTGTKDGVSIAQGGLSSVYHETNEQITHDLAVAEGVAIPLSFLVLILVFGSLVAAFLPLAVGIFAILTTLAILRTLTVFTDVSIFALNMTTALGLALAIDYSLFIVSRFREELGNGLDVEAAVVRAVQTAGRTVLYSALTVALSVAALGVFNLYFLKSFAYSGVAVVAAAAAASILVLPAALMLLGHRVNAGDLRKPLGRLLGRAPRADLAPEQTFWYRTVQWVMRHAAPVAIAIIVLLLAIGSPFLGVKFGYPDDRVLNASAAASSRTVGDALREDFRSNAATEVTIVLDGYRGNPAAVGDYAAALSKVHGVAGVLSGGGVYIGGMQVSDALPQMTNDTGAFLTVATTVDPFTTAGKEQLAQLRDVAGPGPALFGGGAAVNVDSLDALGARLPLAGALIVLTTFVVLFLFTGSVLLPLKALALNTLSLTAAFGAMVWIFQDGHLSGLLGSDATGYLVPTMPILMFCLAFGMSMDYEVFLLSRIREEWLASGRTTADSNRAVALGVARTGKIFTAAALLMAIVMAAMVTSKVSFIQMLGLGLTLTVLADATLIRGLLAPALMKLMGTANWWAPAPLARLHAKIGLHEGETATGATESELAART